MAATEHLKISDSDNIVATAVSKETSIFGIKADGIGQLEGSLSQNVKFVASVLEFFYIEL